MRSSLWGVGSVRRLLHRAMFFSFVLMLGWFGATPVIAAPGFSLVPDKPSVAIGEEVSFTLSGSFVDPDPFEFSGLTVQLGSATPSGLAFVAPLPLFAPTGENGNFYLTIFESSSQYALTLNPNSVPLPLSGTVELASFVMRAAQPGIASIGLVGTAELLKANCVDDEDVTCGNEFELDVKGEVEVTGRTGVSLPATLPILASGLAAMMITRRGGLRARRAKEMSAY